MKILQLEKIQIITLFNKDKIFYIVKFTIFIIISFYYFL